MAESDLIPSFFYANAKPGEPGSYEALLARRKIAESLMGKRSPYPKNIGEGIASLGEATGDVLMLRDLDRREREQAAHEQTQFDALLRGGGSWVPGAGAPPPAAAPPAAAPPAAGGAALPPRPVSVDRARLAGGVADTAPETMDLPNPRTGVLEPVPIYAEKDWSPTDAAVPAAEIAGTRGLPMRFRNNSDVARYIGAERAQSTLTPDMRAGLVSAYNMMSPDERAAFVLNEGGRTPEQQAGYYNRPHTGMVAPPGGSYHQTGNAVDVDPGLGRDWLTRNARLAGLEGLRGDPGHFQLPGGGPRSGLPLIPSVPPVAGGGREAITRALVGRGALGSGPEGDGSATSFAPAPAPAPARAPSPAPLPPTSATPLAGAGGDDRLLGGEGAVAALPPAAGGGGPPPNPPTPTDILPMPAGVMSSTPIAQQAPSDFDPRPASPAPAAPAAALAAGGGVPGALPIAPPGDVAGGPALPPSGITAAPPGVPSGAYRPPWLRGLEEGGFGNPTVPAAGGATSPAPAPVPAPAAELPPAARPAVLGPAGRPDAGTIGRAPAGAPGLLPSQEPLPPPGIPEIPPEVVRTQPPDRLPPSPLAQRMLAFSNMRGISDFRRQQAVEYVRREEEARKEEYQRRLDIYHHQRGREDKLEDERRDIIRTLPEKTVADLKARIDIQAAQGKVEPELLKLWNEVRKTRAEATTAEREASRERVAVAGTHAERRFDPVTGQPVGGFTVPPGLPAMEEKSVTETEASAKQFVERAAPEIRLLSEMKNGVAMTYFKDGVLASRLPFGLSNAAVSDDYRRANAAFGNFGTALMNRVSGAAYSEKEMDRTLAPYKPLFGDTERDLEDKARRREILVKSVSFMVPAEGRAMIEKETFDYGASKPIARGLTDAQINELGPGMRYVKDGQVYQKPIERIRTK
jgi:hypothetical protein